MLPALPAMAPMALMLPALPAMAPMALMLHQAKQCALAYYAHTRTLNCGDGKRCIARKLLGQMPRCRMPIFG